MSHDVIIVGSGAAGLTAALALAEKVKVLVLAKGELTLIPGKGGKASILARVKRGKVEPMFVLVRSVRIPGRGYLATAAERAAEGVEEIMAEGYEKLVTKTVEETPGAAGGAGG